MSDKFNIINTSAGPLNETGFKIRSDGKLTIRPLENCARFSLRISNDHLAEAASAFAQDIPARIGDMSSNADKKVLCLGPDEWLILAPESEGSAIAACFAQLGEHVPLSLVDVAHRNAGIGVSGPAATLLLSAGCPLNLETLPIGGCARTILDKAQIVLMRLDEEHYRLEVLRSFTEFVWSFLTMAGREIDAAPNPQDQVA